MITSTPKHLYIHWPFCSSKCHFCDFVAFEQHENYQEAYHKVLCKEIATFAQQIDPSADRTIDTIFLGGGTPSLYPLPWITELFDVLRQHFCFDTIKEISIETNPADIDEEKLETWRELGITRLSVGIQSLDDDVLLKLNRRQRAQDVLRTMRIAPKYFDNISADFILGLPEVSDAMWFNTIEQAVTWPIKHMSMYFLTIHEKTPLYFKVASGQVTLAHDDALVSAYEKTVGYLNSKGFEQYEISNFAKPGYASIHNQAYWDRKAYKGFGVGASSFDGNTRSTNDNNLPRYLQHGSDSTYAALATSEILTPEQALLELLMLGLRQKKGLDLQRVVYSLEADKAKRFQQNLKQLVQAGLIEEQEGAIRLTLRGMVLENEVVVRLLSD